MLEIDVIMHKIMLSRAGRSDAVQDDICEAYYELRRATWREEAPENPVALLGVIADHLNRAVGEGSVTPAEGLAALSQALNWTLSMVPRPLGPELKAPPPLGSRGYEDPYNYGFPLDELYDDADLCGAGRVPSSVVPQYMAEQLWRQDE